MPIPEFDLVNNILPPFLGDPRLASNMAPYRCLFEDVESQLGTSPERLNILQGLRRFRSELRSMGVIGFQWIDGSFVENCEIQRRLPPGDIDVVTFIEGSCHLDIVKKVVQDTRLNPPESKSLFHVDSYFIHLGDKPRSVVKNTTFWYGLFSHRKGDSLWKGMLEIPLQLSDSDLFTVRSGS